MNGGPGRFRRQAFLPSPAPALGLRARQSLSSLYRRPDLETRNIVLISSWLRNWSRSVPAACRCAQTIPRQWMIVVHGTHRPLPTGWVRACVVLILMAVGIAPALATNGTWTDTTSGGLWSTTTNWSGGIVANGNSSIADFSTLDITADDTVHLDSARTIGELVFGDTAPSNNWILDNNGNAANTLAMASVGNSHITVNNEQAQINLDLEGAGVVVNGPGTLLLGGTTDNTGLGIVVTGGNVILNKASNSGVHAIGGGGLTINGGNVQLGGTGGDQIFDSANVTVTSGAFDTAGQSDTFNVLSLAGMGFGGNGALLNSTTLASTITPTGGTVLTANATLGVLQSSGSLTVNSTISGAFGITKVGPGTLILGGSTANTFSGTTMVNAGTLELDKPGGLPAISGNLIIGTGTGLPGSAVVSDTNALQLFGANVTIQSDGILNLAGGVDEIGNLTMTGGTVTGGTLSPLVISGAAITTNASSYTATISAVGLQIPTVLFTVAQGTTASGIDLDVSAEFSDARNKVGSITKTGPGAMRLSGNNLFVGGVTLNGGTLIIGNNNALGTGMLTAGGGALAADSNGPYIVNNAVSLPTTLTVSGGGNFTLAGPIGGSGGLTKTGEGTLTITGANTYTGTTTITGGSLVLAGGSLTSNVLNQATFIYHGGTFSGRLTNLGTVVVNADFTAGNGMENDSVLTLTTNQAVTLNGAGLDNEGTFTMSGGTLNLNPTGNNVNRGNFNLSGNLGLGRATLTNSGTLAFAGGLVSSASGTLVNVFGGSISGTGSIQSAFANSGGIVTLSGGTLNITQPFSNASLIELSSNVANLVGARSRIRERFRASATSAMRLPTRRPARSRPSAALSPSTAN